MTFEQWWRYFLSEYKPGAFADTAFKEVAKQAWDAGFATATKAAREMLDIDIKE